MPKASTPSSSSRAGGSSGGEASSSIPYHVRRVRLILPPEPLKIPSLPTTKDQLDWIEENVEGATDEKLRCRILCDKERAERGISWECFCDSDGKDRDPRRASRHNDTDRHLTAVAKTLNIDRSTLGSKLWCDAPGCEQSFNGTTRNDSLARHKREAHGIVKYPRRRKQRKQAARAQENIPPVPQAGPSTTPAPIGLGLLAPAPAPASIHAPAPAPPPPFPPPAMAPCAYRPPVLPYPIVALAPAAAHGNAPTPLAAQPPSYPPPPTAPHSLPAMMYQWPSTPPPSAVAHHEQPRSWRATASGDATSPVLPGLDCPPPRQKAQNEPIDDVNFDEWVNLD